MLKDEYKINNNYYPVFNRIADVLYYMNVSYEEIKKMSIEELNMFHYLSYHKKLSETEYWSNYFVELIKAIFGSPSNKITPE